MNLISIFKSITVATDFHLSWRSETLNHTYHCISTDTVPLFWKLISTWVLETSAWSLKGWLTYSMPLSGILAEVFCCSSEMSSLHWVTRGILFASKKGKATKIRRKVKKEKQLQLTGEKMLHFPHMSCFATNKTLNSKSISQRLRKKVRREWMQLVGLNQQIPSSANLTILIASSLKVLQSSAAQQNSTSYGWCLLLGLTNYEPVTPKFSTWIN